MINKRMTALSMIIAALLPTASMSQANNTPTNSDNLQTYPQAYPDSGTGTTNTTGSTDNSSGTQPTSNSQNNSPDMQNATTPSAPITRRSDTDIIADIRTQLANDKSISGQKVDISSNNGVVTIKGNVDTDTQASTIIQTASSVLGVTDINTSDLKVRKSNQPFTDTVITAKVKGAYIREKVFGDREVSAMGVNVETINGVVYLTGKVDNQQQAVNAAAIARSITGVKSVNSRIEVGTSNK